MTLNPECYYGDHEWQGGSVCVFCGTRLRCGCGQFVRSDKIDEHCRNDCPMVFAAVGKETDMKADTEVWFCPNGEWVNYNPDGYDAYARCGALCGVTTYEALPEWAKQEVEPDAGVKGTDDE